MKHSNSHVPNMIIYNARVHVVDQMNHVEEALAIAGNKILAIGTNEEILALEDGQTLLIDAKGHSVIPGINDSHCHMWEAGMLMEGIMTFGIPSIKELKEEVRKRVSVMKPDEWLQGGSWIESQFSEGRMPTKYDLDPVSPDNPVVLERIFSTCVANSAALKAAGITKDTPDPKGGTIGRDENGEPNGLLFRSAKQLVRDAMPSAFGEDKFGSGEQITLAIQRAQDEFLKYGITSVMEAGVTPSMIRAYQRLRREGNLKLRVNLMPCWHGFAINEDEDFSDRLIKELGLSSGFGDEWLRIGSLKMAIDGGLTSKTSLRTWNYVGENKINEFPLRLDLNFLNGWVKEAHDNDWGVGIHVMGDVAVRKAAEAIYAAHQLNPKDNRHQLIHCYYIDEDVMQMMKEARMIFAAQPAFIYNEADGYPKLLHEAQQKTFLPLRSAIDAGVPVSMSTDIPSAHHNPFWGMYSAVTRKGMHGHCIGKEEAITVDEALRAMTHGGAYMSYEEQIKGTLEPGMLADVVILDRSLVDIDEEDIRNVKINMTIVDGHIAYQK